jgi:hypothetical protein
MHGANMKIKHPSCLVVPHLIILTTSGGKATLSSTPTMTHALWLLDRHAPIYAVVTFRKIRHKSNFARQSEFGLPTHWNMIGRNMTSPPPVLSPSSILPPSSHCVFIIARKIWCAFQKGFISVYFNFQACSQNNEKRLSCYSCLSALPSVCLHGTTRFPTGRIFFNLVCHDFS